MNACLHCFGAPLAHIIIKRDHWYVTITAFRRRWHWSNLPSYTHPDYDE
jgi:hypothetical protein